MSIIRLEHISKSYHSVKGQQTVALREVSMSIEAGELIAIVGASGSGKSSLLSVLGLLEDFDEGEYFLNGEPVKDISERDASTIRNKNIGYVFQSFNLIDYKTALQNVEIPLYYAGVARSIRKSMALSMLEKVGLADKINFLPSELSGGQKQRVAIARALVGSPQIILADEPTGSLDSQSSEEIINVLTALSEGLTTVIIVTHDMNIARRCRRIIQVKDGFVTSTQ